MIAHIFNSSIMADPERLILRALREIKEPTGIVFLTDVPRSDRPVRSIEISPFDYAREMGHQVHAVPVKKRWDRQALAALRNLLERLQPRIAHAHDLRASLYLHHATSLLPKFSGKLVSTPHEARDRRGRIRWYEEYRVRRVLPDFDCVLSVCEHDRLSIIRRGVSEARIANHLRGADRPLIPLKDRAQVSRDIRTRWQSVRPALPDADQAIFLGVVGELSGENHLIRILNVLKHLREDGPPMPKPPALLFFGSGPLERKLKGLAEQWGIENHVFFMGPSSTIGQEMAGFDAIFSLSNEEGISMSLLEAGWAGTPVFAAKAGGAPDLISSPALGCLLEFQERDQSIADRVRAAFADPTVLALFGENLRDQIKLRFSQQSWLNRLQEIYQQLDPVLT